MSRHETTKFAAVVAETLGLEKVRRLIIDFKPNSPVTVYAEMYATESVFKIDWSALEGVDIKMVQNDE